jgi:hypothetical protein
MVRRCQAVSPSVRRTLPQENTTQVRPLRDIAPVRTLQLSGTHYPLNISNRLVRIGSVRPALSTGIAFLLGVFHRSRQVRCRQAGEGSLSSGELHSPSQGVVCVSRPLGNSDTTACRSALQVARRQKSHVAGIEIGTRLIRQPLPDAQNATPHEVALCVPVLVTGLPANNRRWCVPPCLWQTFPAGLPFFGAARWRMLLPGVCWFVGWPDYSSSRYITGTL